MAKILGTCSMLEKQIMDEGHRHGNTLEILTPRIDMDISGFDIDREEEEIKVYYGDKWSTRCLDELYHYKKIEYSLLHKVKEIKYFFKQEVDNRKTIIFSEDCISSVQYLKRAHTATLLVHMRSSDVKELLPIDLLNLAKILRRVTEEYTEPGEVTAQYITVIIGSAHVYLSGGRV